MMYIIKYFLCLCCALNCTMLHAQILKEGFWVGTISENKTIYSYTLHIQSVIGNKITGLSVSKNSTFNCTTSFQGTMDKNVLQISEKKILYSNYSRKNEICLMNLNLQLKDSLLTGTFTSNNYLNQNCGKGTVRLNVQKNDLDNVSNTVNNKKDTVQTPDIIIKTDTSSNTKDVIINNQEEVLSYKPSRKIDISNIVYLPTDSIHIEIYDNGVIDGDEVTLWINGSILYKKRKLSEIPVEFDLKKNKSKEYIIEFYAENLGSIPPNTGLIIIKNNMFRKELNFSSDFSKTHAVKFVFK